MAEVGGVVELDGVEYVTKAAYDAVTNEIGRLKHVLASIKRQASEPLAASTARRARRGTSPDGEDGSEITPQSAQWRLYKIQGEGYSSDDSNRKTVQVYRVDTGGSSTEAAATGPTDSATSSAITRFYFRPRDVIQMVAAADLWSPAMLKQAEDKVDNQVNKKKVASIQEKETVSSMVRQCMSTYDKGKRDMKGLQKYDVCLITFEAMIELYVKLVSDCKAFKRRENARRAADAEDDFDANSTPGGGAAGGAAAAAAAEAAPAAGSDGDADDSAQDSVADEAFWLQDVTAAFAWMADVETEQLDAEHWEVPLA